MGAKGSKISDRDSLAAVTESWSGIMYPVSFVTKLESCEWDMV
jgi:hypothetical protein